MKGYTKCDCCGAFTNDMVAFELDISYYATEEKTYIRMFEGPITTEEMVKQTLHYDLCGSCMTKYSEQINKIVPGMRVEIIQADARTKYEEMMTKREKLKNDD